MNLVSFALRRPISLLTMVIGVALVGFLAVDRMSRDIFPDLGVPTIYVAQPYGGLDPAQMEGVIVNYYEYHFLYITGIEHVESKSIQGVALIKLQFHPGTDMAQALAETVSYLDRPPDLLPMVPVNSVVGDFKGLSNIPIRSRGTQTIFIRDVGSVEDGADIQTGYALVDGRRTVYIPVTKRADASTLAVVQAVKANLPRFQSVLPDDIAVSYKFDQSPYVTRAIQGLFFEGALGVALTSLMILLFLRDWRSAMVVVLNIPLAILASATALWVSAQTINIMTLGGLALAVGIFEG